MKYNILETTAYAPAIKACKEVTNIIKRIKYKSLYIVSTSNAIHCIEIRIYGCIYTGLTKLQIILALSYTILRKFEIDIKQNTL